MYSSKIDWVAMNSRSDLHSSSWRRSVTKQYVKCPLRWNMLHHNLIFLIIRVSFLKHDSVFQRWIMLFKIIYTILKCIFLNSFFIYFYFICFCIFMRKWKKKFGFDKCMLLISIKSCPVLPIISNFETAVTCLWHV